MEKTIIAYYTGTGSSRLVAQEVRDQLIARGVSVEVHRLTKATKEDLRRKVETCNDLILIYAVHAFNAPNLVYEWLSELVEQPTSAGQRKKAMIISVSGGGEILSNTACRVTAKRWLIKKGYNVVTEAMAVMPNNWMSPTPLEVSKALIQILPDKVNQWLGAYSQSKPFPFYQVKLVDRMITRLGRLEVKGARRFGKSIKVNEVCNGCGWCESHCPASNIRLVKRYSAEVSIPEFGKGCDFCLGCIYGCPQKALTPGKFKFAVIQAGYPLAKYQQSSELPLEESELMALLKGPSWNGIRRYLDL
ncbi:MAG: EFR1 family ferrodoxin [Bacillota bacterium]|nr:EFR1 family ferrodoxin [Bacillota bacterium]